MSVSKPDKVANQAPTPTLLQRLVVIDHFKYPGRPEHVNGDQGSVIGVIGTFALLAIILAYAISTGDRWLSSAPSTSIGQGPTPTEQNVTIPRTCVALPNITDPSYFGFTLQRQDRNVAGGTARRTNLDWYADGPNKMCVNTTNDSYMRGFCNPGNCAIVKFKLYFCGVCETGGVQNPSCGRSDCVSYSTLSSILQSNYMAVTYETMNGPILLNAAPKSAVDSSYTTSFDYTILTYLPDYWRRMTESETTGLTLNNNAFALLYVYTPNPPNHEVAEVVLQLSANYKQTTYSQMTVLDLIASWGAFFGVIASVLGIPLALFNKYWFYKQNPKWARIGTDFVPLPAREGDADFDPARDVHSPSPYPGVDAQADVPMRAYSPTEAVVVKSCETDAGQF